MPDDILAYTFVKLKLIAAEATAYLVAISKLHLQVSTNQLKTTTVLDPGLPALMTVLEGYLVTPLAES